MEGAFQLYFKMSGFVADVMNDSFSLQLQMDTHFFHGVVDNGVFLEAVWFFIHWKALFNLVFFNLGAVCKGLACSICKIMHQNLTIDSS